MKNGFDYLNQKNLKNGKKFKINKKNVQTYFLNFVTGITVYIILSRNKNNLSNFDISTE